MLCHQENLFKTFNITYHVKYIPYPRLSYRPYDGTMCPVKGLYHEMHSIVIACRGEMPVIAAASSYLAYVQKRGGLSQQKGALRGTAVAACLFFAARATALARLSIFFLPIGRSRCPPKSEFSEASLIEERVCRDRKKKKDEELGNKNKVGET